MDELIKNNPKDMVVIQSNKLIRARYDEPLTLREQKIIYTAISKIKKNDDYDKIYMLDVNELFELMGLDRTTRATNIEETMDKLMKRVVTLDFVNEKGENGWFKTHWVSTCEYIKGQRTIKIQFEKKMKDFLFGLVNNFTQYELLNVMRMSSNYSISLFQLLKSYAYIGEVILDLETLRNNLGVSKNSYKSYAMLKSKVLKKSIEEINEKTDITVDYEEIKRGKKVVSVRFKIKDKNNRGDERINTDILDIAKEKDIIKRFLLAKRIDFTEKNFEKIKESFIKTSLLIFNDDTEEKILELLKVLEKKDEEINVEIIEQRLKQFKFNYLNDLPFDYIDVDEKSKIRKLLEQHNIEVDNTFDKTEKKWLLMSDDIWEGEENKEEVLCQVIAKLLNVKDINNYIGFITSKLKQYYKNVLEGKNWDYGETKNTPSKPKGRTEKIPEWFDKKNIEPEPDNDIDYEAERQRILAKLGKTNGDENNEL